MTQEKAGVSVGFRKRRGSRGTRAELIRFPLEKHAAEDKKHRDIQRSQDRAGQGCPCWEGS